MLTHLHIRHFAIIDSSELELDAGMTALTGETGAGKSILLDALGLVLGARASASSVQQDASRADITASFSLDKLAHVSDWLTKHELDADDECLIRRTLNSNGKSRATINDVPVSAQSLRELGEKLVTIHGQHAYQTMSKPAEQRLLLDEFAGKKQCDSVAKAFIAWHQADAALSTHTQDAIARQQRIDLISFQLQEFDDLDIGQMSIEQIESEHRWLASAEKIIALGAAALEATEDTAYPALSQSIAPIAELVQIDERLRESLDLIESASIQVAEATQLIRASISALEHDDARLGWLDHKLASLHRLAKKHHCDIADLSTVEHTLREEYDALLDPAQGVTQLQNECDVLLDVYQTTAKKLSRHRRKFAKLLAKNITEAMQGLNMTGGVFDIVIETQNNTPRPHGNDNVSFQVSPNPGVSPAPLSKIASGGELSRISLCMQLATLETQTVPTLVFDEVDSGVGGAVAETVGQLLRRVGKHAQVLCVTHLPQVAAQAHHHIKINKSVSKGKTNTAVQALDAKATRDEIARMLGGAKITSKSRQHAQEMLDSAASLS